MLYRLLTSTLLLTLLCGPISAQGERRPDVTRDPDAAWREIERLLESSNPLDRKGGVLRLAELKDQRALVHLVRSVRDPSEIVVEEAVRALLRRARGGEEAAVLEAVSRRARASRSPGIYIPLLDEIATLAAHEVVHTIALSVREPRELAIALRALRRFANGRDARLAHGLLGSTSPRVRKEACVLLGLTRHEAAVSDLIALLESDEDRRVVRAALRSLQQISKLRLGRHPKLWRTWWERRQEEAEEDQSPFQA